MPIIKTGMKFNTSLSYKLIIVAIIRIALSEAQTIETQYIFADDVNSFFTHKFDNITDDWDWYKWDKPGKSQATINADCAHY